MEFETIKKDNRKKWIIGVIAILVVCSVVFFVSTRANYKTEQRLNLINKTVNWNPTDLEIVSIRLKSGSNYRNVNTVPTSGYILSDKSYCEVDGNKDTSISMEYKNGKVTIGVTKKGTKCYLYFDVNPCPEGATACSTILANKTIEERTSYSSVLKENTTGKIYKTQDDDGDTYYFAGAVDNNWVQFGEENGNQIYWRIIRINGDGTIRLIYNGTSIVQTGTSTQIGTYKFSHKDATGSPNYTYINDNAYVGYMYGTVGSSTYNETHTNTNSSYAKQKVDEWYNTNLNKTGIKEKISINTGFCGDRSMNSISGTGLGYGTNHTVYSVRNRLYINKKPSLKCTNSNDLYTVSNSNKGNKALTYPVGLITADEVAYAGAVYNTSNNSYYLYTAKEYWTISPNSFYNTAVTLYYVSSLGYMYERIVSDAKGLRPVINLNADTQFSAEGDGTTAHPYIVV